MRFRGSLLLVLLTAAFISSILGARGQEPTRTEMLVRTDWLERHLQDPNLIVLCVVDEEQFYSGGHIPGARMIRLTEIVTTLRGIPNELPPIKKLRKVFERAGVNNDSHIILYGERFGMLAARAYFTLDYLGIADRAALLDGGLEKWRAERRPESLAIPVPRVSDLEIHAHPEILVSLEEMADYSHSASGPAIIDARPEDEYTGKRFSENVSKRGHIPHAAGLYWRNFFRDGSIPEMKPVAQLEDMFRAAGAIPDRGAITYCRTGMQSSFSYFVAKYLGYKARMYDGSFFEWSRSSLPVQP